MARHVGIRPLTPDASRQLEQFNVGFESATPPWYYMLKEAEVVNNGTRLGPLGGRIVAEVIIGVLQGDRSRSSTRTRTGSRSWATTRASSSSETC